MRIAIGEVEPGRIDEIVPLWRENMAHHASLMPFFRPAPDGASAWRNWAAVSVAAGQGAAFAARAGETAAGFVFGRIQEAPSIFQATRLGYIYDLYVRPAYRRQGVGRLLFLAVRDWFADRGAEALELQAYLANEEAGAFWRAMGLAVYAERMRMDIAPAAGEPRG